MVIYFTSDIHGSEKCWRKFLATPQFYGADVIIVGGDITGKFVVPIVEQRDGTWITTVNGDAASLADMTEVEALTRRIMDAGSYPFKTTASEYADYTADASQRDALFSRLILDRVEGWVKLADERLDRTPTKCIVSGGNDDFWEVDEVLASSRTICMAEGRVVELNSWCELCGLGYANVTPWHCPRDISEEELSEKVDTLARQIRRMDRAIFDIHVPPYESSLDTGPQLDSDFNVVRSASGEIVTIPVGSTAVRDAIVKYQPMLGLHGHVHESAGVRRLGRTTIVNPGSEYQEGVLRGVLINVNEKKGVVSAQLVAG